MRRADAPSVQPPSLVHPGVGSGWWRGRWGWAVADGCRLWLIGDPVVQIVPATRVAQVVDRGDRVAVIGEDDTVRLVDPATGAVEAAPPDGVVWVDRDAGFVYRRWQGRIRAVDVVGPGEIVRFGPRGAVVAGPDTITRGGAPGRAPRPLAVALAPEGLRWSEDGVRIAGLTEDGDGVVVDLASGGVRRVDGVPVDLDTWRVGGRIVAAGRALRRGVVEASAAAWGRWLAGPGGWVWALAHGTATPVVRRRCVALGATVGTPDGFVTVDWETGRGWTVGFDGARSRPFVLPLAPEDTVVGGAAAEGAAWFETALGAGFRVAAGVVHEADESPLAPGPPQRVALPGGAFQPTARADLDGSAFVADDDGWLLRLPAA